MSRAVRDSILRACLGNYLHLVAYGIDEDRRCSRVCEAHAHEVEFNNGIGISSLVYVDYYLSVFALTRNCESSRLLYCKHAITDGRCVLGSVSCDVSSVEGNGQISRLLGGRFRSVGLGRSHAAGGIDAVKYADICEVELSLLAIGMSYGRISAEIKEIARLCAVYVSCADEHVLILLSELDIEIFACRDSVRLLPHTVLLVRGVIYAVEERNSAGRTCEQLGVYLIIGSCNVQITACDVDSLNSREAAVAACDDRTAAYFNSRTCLYCVVTGLYRDCAAFKSNTALARLDTIALSVYVESSVLDCNGALALNSVGLVGRVESCDVYSTAVYLDVVVAGDSILSVSGDVKDTCTLFAALYRNIVLCLYDCKAEIVARIGSSTVGDRILCAVNEVYRRIFSVCDKYCRSALSCDVHTVEEYLDRLGVSNFVCNIDVYLTVVERAVNVICSRMVDRDNRAADSSVIACDLSLVSLEVDVCDVRSGCHVSRGRNSACGRNSGRS